MIYTAHIGQKLLDTFNQANNTNLTPKLFFLDKFFPLFFGQGKFMMPVGNSALGAPKLRSGQIPDSASLKTRLTNLLNNIENNPAHAVGVGFPSVGLNAPSSCQNINAGFPITPDTNYLSWIGGACSIGVAGGQCIFVENPEILSILKQGWLVYRAKLSENDNLKDLQISSWNGQYLAHYLDPRKPLSNIMDNILDKDNKIKPVLWTTLLSRLAIKYPETTTVFVGSFFGQTDTTIGYILLKLGHIKEFFDYYSYLYADYLDDLDDIELVLSLATSFFEACLSGSISLSDYKLVKYQNTKELNKVLKKLNDNIVLEKTLKTWIFAMTKDKEFIEMAPQFALVLYHYAYNPNQSSRQGINVVNNLLQSKSKLEFGEILNTIIKSTSDNANSELLFKIFDKLNQITWDLFKWFVVCTQNEYLKLKKGIMV